MSNEEDIRHFRGDSSLFESTGQCQIVFKVDLLSAKSEHSPLTLEILQMVLLVITSIIMLVVFAFLLKLVRFMLVSCSSLVHFLFIFCSFYCSFLHLCLLQFDRLKFTDREFDVFRMRMNLGKSTSGYYPLNNVFVWIVLNLDSFGEVSTM